MAAPGKGAADGINRRAVLLGGLALGAGLAAACGDDGGGSAQPDAGTGGEGDLLDRLAEDGDVEVLDRTYAASGADGAPALVLAVAGSDAVGYLCDPHGPARWFTGEVRGGRVTLTDGGEATMSGAVADDACSVELDGTPADGAYELPASTEVTLARSSEVHEGEVPGGLIIDGTVATGSFQFAAPTGLLDAASTVGVRVVAGRTLDVAVFLDLLADARDDIDELDDRIAELDDQIEQLAEMARKIEQVAAKIEALLPQLLGALGRDGGTNCGEVTAVSGVLVAVVVQVVAQVVGQTTTRVPDTSVVERDLLRVAGRADPIAGALDLLATYDVTKGQLLLQTVRQSLRRLGNLPSTASGSSSTTTTTAPPRPAPAPGSVDVTLATS